MAHPPNADAACFFAREVLPTVRRRVPEAEFWIVGRDPTAEVAALARLPGVVVTGFVADIRPFIDEAAVVVAPLRFGSGMRNKILEAWAMDKCVVATHVGAEGLDCTDGVDILLGDDAPALASQVSEALTDAELRERIRGRGRRLVATAHDPHALARRYRDAIRAALPPAPEDDAPLRAVIDLRWMRPGRAGGIENLSRSFLDELLRGNRRDQFTVLAPRAVSREFSVRAGPGVLFRAAGDGPRALARRGALAAARFLHARAKVRYWRTPEVEALRRARAMEAEVALSMPGFIHPDLAALTNVLIVPDIQHEFFPEFFAPDDLAERRRAYTASAKRAARVCAISEFTRRTVIDRFGVPEARITTAHLAADPIFHPGSAARRDTALALARYGLTAGTYLLFPGNTWPHKNHQVAIAALRVLREAHGLDPLLVCTGSPREAHGDLLAKIEEAHLAPRVRFLGYCPQADMPALYVGAAALVFPSLFEGFGLPLLEAMWCDCPVVCSNTTSLPEVAGNAAVLVDPRSPEELAHALSRVLTDVELRRDLIERGRRRAGAFSWAAFTAEILRALRGARRLRYGT
jgi:glycosyltransferase involved in cell wall biosynthesis